MNSLLLNRFVDESHERLKASALGFEYLRNARHFSVDTIKRERMGFCDREIASSFLSEVDKDDPQWKHSHEYYEEMLCDRVILPICDDSGQVVAISTRVPEKDTKGWWNSPFYKENILYGLNHAKNAVFARNKIYVVEGYADAISLWQAGLRNVVAMMGTTLTRIQHGLVLRYCSNICACFDTDPTVNNRMGGGQAGLERFVRECQDLGFYDTISAVVMPMGKGARGEEIGADPDDFVRENGLKAYLDLEKRVLLY